MQFHRPAKLKLERGIFIFLYDYFHPAVIAGLFFWKKRIEVKNMEGDSGAGGDNLKRRILDGCFHVLHQLQAK